MTLGEYLKIHELNYDDVIIKKESGEVIKSYGCLIQYYDVLKIIGNELTIR